MVLLNLIAAANLKHGHVGLHCRQVELLVEAAEGCVTVPPEVYLCKATTQFSEARCRAAAIMLKDEYSEDRSRKMHSTGCKGAAQGSKTQPSSKRTSKGPSSTGMLLRLPLHDLAQHQAPL